MHNGVSKVTEALYDAKIVRPFHQSQHPGDKSVTPTHVAASIRPKQGKKRHKAGVSAAIWQPGSGLAYQGCQGRAFYPLSRCSATVAHRATAYGTSDLMCPLRSIVYEACALGLSVPPGRIPSRLAESGRQSLQRWDWTYVPLHLSRLPLICWPKWCQRTQGSEHPGHACRCHATRLVFSTLLWSDA